MTVVEGKQDARAAYEGIIIGIHKAGVATSITVRKAFRATASSASSPITLPLCTFEEVRGTGQARGEYSSFASSTRRFSLIFATDAWKRVSARVSGVPASAAVSRPRPARANSPNPPQRKTKPSKTSPARKKRFFIRPPRADPSPLFPLSQVRRAKLYLRDRIGKQAKLKTRFVAKKTGPTRHQLKMEALRGDKGGCGCRGCRGGAAAEAGAPRLPRLRRRLPPRRRRLPLSPRRKRVDSFLVGVFHGVCPGLAALVRTRHISITILLQRNRTSHRRRPYPRTHHASVRETSLSAERALHPSSPRSFPPASAAFFLPSQTHNLKEIPRPVASVNVNSTEICPYKT